MRIKFLVVLWLALAGLLLVSCSSAVATKVTSVSVTQASTVPAFTPTSLPSATSQPGKVILVAPSGAGAQAVLNELSSTSGLTVETRPELKKEDLSPEMKVVVLLSSPANLSELVTAAPQTQFIVVSPTDLQPASNLTVIRQKLEDQAFVAGYLTALLSTDYRAGGLIPADGPLAGLLTEAFANGARFYCGVCAPGWPLNLYYPQVAALPAASDGPAWQAAAAGLYDTQKVDVVYVSTEAARQEVFDYWLGKTQFDKPVLLVSAQTPPEGIKPQWTATVRFDLDAALRQAWADAATGMGGGSLDAPLVIENSSSNQVLAGRMRLVKEVIAGLQAGTIYPFTVPQQ